MKIETLATEQRLPRPLEGIFPFFQSPENLALITPDYLKFRLLSRSPVTMKKGAVIDYTISLYCIPLHWRTLITDYEPPFRFIDKQLNGPYAFWEHEHVFHEEDGQTVMTDTIKYALPTFLPTRFSRTFHDLYVRRRLDDIFDYRQSVILMMFGREPLS